MTEKKVILFATLIVCGVVSAPVAASASVVHTPASGHVIFRTDDSSDDSSANSSDDHPSSNTGDGDHDRDDRHKRIPPSIVMPDTNHASNVGGINPASNVGGINPGKPGQTPPPKDGNVSLVNPEKEHPIDIDKVPMHHRSPADAFMDSAYLSLGLLALSAAGIGITAGIRAIRLRRGGKADYIYNDK